MRQFYKITVDLLHLDHRTEHLAVIECASASLDDLILDVNQWASEQHYEVSRHCGYHLLREAKLEEAGVVSVISDKSSGQLTRSLVFPDYGRTATVHPHAPKNYRPAETGSVYSLDRVTDEEGAGRLMMPLGALAVGVELDDGSSIHVPAGWLLVHDA
ncbi:MAG: hypothetical protein AAFS13_10630 [Pseudomonadota bacterium]